MSIDKTYEGKNEIFDHTRHYFRIPFTVLSEYIRKYYKKK